MTNLNRSFDEKMELLKRIGTATLYEAQGAVGALDSQIKPISADMSFAGPAFTIDMKPSDNLMIHKAMLHVRKGDILVADVKGYTEAGPWGDVLTCQAMHLGVRGLVINGSVRDSNEIIKLGFPVFSLGLCIKGTGKNQPGRLNTPIVIAGAEIKPNDIVVGDRDGVVVIDRCRLDEVISLSLDRQRKESDFVERIKLGESTITLLGLEDKVKSL